MNILRITKVVFILVNSCVFLLVCGISLAIDIDQ